MIHVMRYLRGTIETGLFYSKTCNPFATLHTNDDLSNDKSHAQEVGSKSRSGHVDMMAGAAVSCLNKEQPVVSISSTELSSYTQ